MNAVPTTLSRMIGLLGTLLPIILLIGGLTATPSIEWQSAISDYYHTCIGYLFVGGMLAIGAFLICYRADGNKEDLITDVAGGLAMLVALFPTDGGKSVVGHVHWVSAGLFILSMAFVSHRVFAKEDSMSKTLYRGCAYVICLCVVLLFIANNMAGWPDRTIWWLETIAILTFGVAWMKRSL